MLLLLACASDPTWSDDVRPIVASSCVDCHADGAGAPFPLQTWAEAAPVAESLAAAAESGSMPPWKADPACHRYEDERILTDEQITTLRAWADAGAAEGDPTDPLEADPETITATETFGPDAPYTPDFSAGDDDYQCFVLDRTFDVPQFLTASRVLPGSAQVHHVFLFLLTGDQVPQMEALDAADPGPGYTCFGNPVSASGVSLLTSVGGLPEMLAVWAPGARPQVAPEGMAYGLPAGARLVIQVHYARSAEPVPDETLVEVTLTDEPPDQLLRSRPLIDTRFEIEAGDADAEVVRTVTNYTDAEIPIRAVLPHLHLLGTAIDAGITRADGGEDCLVDVPEWDFAWQLRYALPEPEVLAPDDSLTLRCHYDNSAENQPIINGEQGDPEDVHWGENTTDEMCLLYMEQVEDYTGLSASDAPSCDDYAACGCAEPSLDCLASCPTTDLTCAVCTLQAGADCGTNACLTEAAAMQDCLSGCMMGTVALGSGLGACLEATCPTEYAALAECVDPYLSSPECAEPLAACGVE